MGQEKKVDQASRITKQKKIDLRLDLPRLLHEAGSNEEAARIALRACLVLSCGIPKSLLTANNITGALSLREIVAALDRLAISEIRHDAAHALAAIRSASMKEIGGTADKRLLSWLTRSVTTKLLKLSGAGAVGQKKTKGLNLERSVPPRITAETISSAASLALWTLNRAPECRPEHKVKVHSLVLQWVSAVQAIWRSDRTPAGIIAAMKFIRSLRSTLSPTDYVQLESDHRVASFFQDVPSAIFAESSNALLNGRLKDLEALFSLIDTGKDGHARFLSGLQDICQSQSSDIPQEAVEWVARRIEATTHHVSAPSASDHSQSAELDDVSVCLLSAWDAASESDKSKRVLDNIRRLAHDLFQLDLIGTPGEVVPYDERQHDLKAQDQNPPGKVEITRPAVRWSDGVRTRFLIRAVVKAAH